MSASPDLFTGRRPLRVDLRTSSAWEPLATAPGVHLSYCGRYTVVRSDEPAPRYLAFRRFGSAGTRDWQPPKLLGSFMKPAEARAACAEHAERNP